MESHRTPSIFAISMRLDSTSSQPFQHNDCGFLVKKRLDFFIFSLTRARESRLSTGSVCAYTCQAGIEESAKWRKQRFPQCPFVIRSTSFATSLVSSEAHLQLRNVKPPLLPLHFHKTFSEMPFKPGLMCLWKGSHFYTRSCHIAIAGHINPSRVLS